MLIIRACDRPTGQLNKLSNLIDSKLKLYKMGRDMFCMRDA